VASVAPQAAGGDAAARGEARRRGEGGRRLGAAPGAAPDGHHAPLERPADPLDDFFFRADESGPDLGALEASAEAPASPAEVVERVEYLTFLLGAEEYGVEIGRVREVMRSPPITEVPRAPADVLGVITVRGEVVAVFDPRGRLGLPRGGSAEGGRVIIVDDGAGACGLLVDGVTSVVRLPRGSIEACPQGIGGASAECLEGIGRDQERLFTVLSVPALLKPARRAEGRG
jgi:purine-binding chemotaxis protein CheW